MDEMETVLRALKDADWKMTDRELVDACGLDYGTVETALHRLLLRGLVRCDSFDPSKRGGQAGVRRWGVSHFTPLWEAADAECTDS